jgi:hypothetical protein
MRRVEAGPKSWPPEREKVVLPRNCASLKKTIEIFEFLSKLSQFGQFCPQRVQAGL